MNLYTEEFLAAFCHLPAEKQNCIKNAFKSLHKVIPRLSYKLNISKFCLNYCKWNGKMYFV